MTEIDTASVTRATQVPIGEATKQIDEELRALIVKALAVKTRSYSSFGGKETGNAYQAVRLRDEVLAGFRVSDEDVWAGLGVEGRTVIDLGCNLGERTRLAVRAGASFAEGIEYEDLFVRIGGLINVYNRMHNILLRQGDVTKPGCLEKSYDIVACFSAFVYVRENLEEILSKCTRLFVLETHALGKGWFDRYISGVECHLPHWVVYGFSDHGAALTEQKRTLAVFARDPAVARDVPYSRGYYNGIQHRNIARVRIAESAVISRLCGEPGRGTSAFFAEFRNTLQRETEPTIPTILESLKKLGDHLSDCAVPTEQERFRSDFYWIKLCGGLVQYVETGVVAPGNEYVVFLRELVNSNKYDPGMKEELSTPERAAARLRYRFDAFLSTFRTKQVKGPPIIVFNAVSGAALMCVGMSEEDYAPSHFLVEEHGRRYLAPTIDGNHRLAALYLSGAYTAPCSFVWSNLYPINQTRSACRVPSQGAGWEDRNIGGLVEATVSELFDPKPQKS